MSEPSNPLIRLDMDYPPISSFFSANIVGADVPPPVEELMFLHTHPGYGGGFLEDVYSRVQEVNECIRHPKNLAKAAEDPKVCSLVQRLAFLTEKMAKTLPLTKESAPDFLVHLRDVYQTSNAIIGMLKRQAK